VLVEHDGTVVVLHDVVTVQPVAVLVELVGVTSFTNWSWDEPPSVRDGHPLSAHILRTAPGGFEVTSCAFAWLEDHAKLGHILELEAAVHPPRTGISFVQLSGAVGLDGSRMTLTLRTMKKRSPIASQM
jgi:hypothetical protein